MRELLVRRLRSGAFPARFAIMLVDELHHLFERRSGEENLVHAFAFHHCGIVMCDGAAAAAEHLDIVGAFFAQKIDNRAEELAVPAVIARNPNRAHIFLDRGAHDIADRTMITEIHDLDAVPDEFEIDGVDRAVVPVANRDGGEDANWRRHRWRRDNYK